MTKEKKTYHIKTTPRTSKGPDYRELRGRFRTTAQKRGDRKRRK
ncbi:MAG: hypothetical protein ACOC38_05505 [Promethearchaeia archaeon]